MKYREADLDYIFIRAQDQDGKWQNLSLNAISDEQFLDWAERRFGIEVKDDANATGTPWTSAQKVDFLNDMNKRLGNKPCVTMIRKEARNKWGKNEKEGA